MSKQRVDPAELHHVLVNDVECCFLMAFCDAQKCSDILFFIVAVEKFRERYGERRLMQWKTYEELDELGEEAENNMHKTLDMNLEQVKREADVIWEDFFSSNPTFDILCPSGIITNIRRRLKLIDVFGPETFSEAVVEPLKTVFRDIWPRYLLSENYKEMQVVEQLLSTEADPACLCVSFPQNIVHATVSENVKLKESVMTIMQNVDNYVKDPLLYGELLSYVRREYVSENLLCLRSVDRFEEFALGNADELPANSSGSNKVSGSRVNLVSTAESAANAVSTRGGKVKVCAEAKDQGWAIYRYFLRDNACLQIPVKENELKKIVSHLACPYPNIFDCLREVAVDRLHNNFESFKNSSEFRDLFSMVIQREERHLADVKKKTGVHGDSTTCIIC